MNGLNRFGRALFIAVCLIGAQVAFSQDKQPPVAPQLPGSVMVTIPFDGMSPEQIALVQMMNARMELMKRELLLLREQAAKSHPAALNCDGRV